MTTPRYQRFFADLKRRRVFRVMAVYGAVAFVILQVADIALPGLGLPEWTITLILALTLLGFPFAIVLAWAFDMTPEGVQRTADATPAELSQIISAPASQRWPAGVLALVGITALLAGAWYVGRQSASASAAAPASSGVSSASVAVLPFVNMSSDPEQEYFSDGISEELLNLLAKIPGLEVAARTSSFSYKGKDVKVADVARELNVAHVLEGSVRKSGDQVRITAQLIRADNGFHLWSDTWDRSLDDIFKIQDEIAADVVEQLKVTLLGDAPTVVATDPEAYSLYLQARQLGRLRTSESFEQAIALYKRALEIDPDYPAVWAGLARIYYSQASGGLRPREEGYALAREAANEALGIDPEYALAYARLGRIAMDYDRDRVAAARYLERALGLDPMNPDIAFEAAVLAANIGRVDEAIALDKYVVARDPVNSAGHHNLGLVYRDAGRLDEAMTSLRTALNLSPGYSGAQYFIGEALLLKGQPEAALAAFAEEGDEEYRVKGTALALHALGRREEFEAAFRDLRERWGEEWPSEVAHVYAWTGNADAAFEWLDRAVAQKEGGLNEQFRSPFYAPLRDDPRWAAFRERTGTSEEQLAAIKFEVTLPR
jgi:TolB-like protein/tetratricopeptide (TPR) repeat protein